jgi:hypothetical protein
MLVVSVSAQKIGRDNIFFLTIDLEKPEGEIVGMPYF